MSIHSDQGRYLISVTEAGLLIIHSSPATLSWIPRDLLNDAYNVGGIVTVGTFDNIDEAKRAAKDQYSAGIEDWQMSDVLPFDMGGETQTETHTPDIDGHNFVRHGIHWK